MPKRERQAPADTQTQTEQRVERIADMMRRFRYRRGATPRVLAEEWGLSLDRVHVLTAAASHRVRAELEDPDRVRIDVCQTLVVILRRARAARTRTVYGKDGAVGEENDWAAAKVAIEAAKTWATITGNAAATQVHVTGPVLPPDALRATLLALLQDVDGEAR